MDRADKLINNREPKRMMIMFAVILAVSVAICFFVSARLADAVVSYQIKAELSAVAGGKFTAPPDEVSVAAGETIAGQYGISADMNPRLMAGWQDIRRTFFVYGFALTLCIDFIWLFFGLKSLYRVYDGIEAVRAECINIAEDMSYRPSEYGDDLSCVRRLSESVSLTALRLEHLTGSLKAEKIRLSDFLADLSHQLKTSLSVIRLNSDMLSELDNIPPEKREQLSDEMTLHVDAMEELVLSALKLARIDAGAVEYDLRELSLYETCEEAIERMTPLLRASGITASLYCPHEIVMSHDKAWLCEAVENIIKNAVDHSECSEIWVSVRELPALITISVEDNGRGISQSDIPRLFDRFGRRSRGRSMTSVGIGLSIAKKIAIAHSGEITVYSEQNKGTRFDMSFLKV